MVCPLEAPHGRSQGSHGSNGVRHAIKYGKMMGLYGFIMLVIYISIYIYTVLYGLHGFIMFYDVMMFSRLQPMQKRNLQYRKIIKLGFDHREIPYNGGFNTIYFTKLLVSPAENWLSTSCMVFFGG